MFFDPVYMLYVMLPALILSGIAQFFVRSAYGKWGKTRNGFNLPGREVAQRIMRQTNLNVGLERIPGQMTDHYDPRAEVVRMSQDVADTPSVAAMAIVAHEFGHVQQHHQNSILIQMRSFLLPAVQFSPMISYGLIFVGFLLQAADLIWLGAMFFGVVVLFMLLTLPVEIDASMRGMRLLRETGLMTTHEDANGSRQVLTAAALTYVAAFISALLQMLYYLSLAQRRR